MKTLASVLVLLDAAVLAASACSAPATATPSTTPTSKATTYQIENFATRKYDRKNIATTSSSIVATNGGTLERECAHYDPATGATTDAFESSKVCFYGANSFISFSYTDKDDISETNNLY